MSLIITCGTRASLAATAAARIIARLEELHGSKDVVTLALTGGTIAMEVYAELAKQVPESLVHPAWVHLWFGDERFVAETDPDRNVAQARAALGGVLDDAEWHPMGSADAFATPEEAAAAYAAELGDTVIDLCLVGVGPDGHCLSIFPGAPGQAVLTPTVIGVRNSPKPPPLRVSLTTTRASQSTAVWFIVAGKDKAEPVHQVLNLGATLPSGQVDGTDETIWFLDRDASGKLA